MLSTYREKNHSIEDICKTYGVSPSTLYRYDREDKAAKELSLNAQCSSCVDTFVNHPKFIIMKLIFKQISPYARFNNRWKTNHIKVGRTNSYQEDHPINVGPGWATYSKLLRQPDQVWHTIEIHKPYIERFSLEKYYDKIFILDVCKFKPEITYDVIILGDVIEHIKKPQSISALGRLFKKSQWCIISLPLDKNTRPYRKLQRLLE